MGRSNTRPGDQSIPGSDFLQLSIGDAPVGGLSAWLAQRLRLAISDGLLPVGSRLPATRVLAGDLRVSRGVVTEAYQRLIEDGQAAGRGRGGTIVVAAPIAAPAAARQTLPASQPPSAVFAAPPGADVFDSLRAIPARIDLSPGVPDLAAFPRTAWLRAERSVLSDLSPADFGYGDPRGAPAFRLAVANWLARNRGIRVNPDEVIIVAGVAQALGLLAQALRHNGICEVAVEDPGSLGTRQLLQSWQLDTSPIPVDPAGLRVGELRASGAPAVLLTPAHQFPTGVVLDGQRRRELMQWANDGGLIIEDDYDAEHRYDRPRVLAPRKYRDAVVTAKRNADLGSAVLPQLVLAELMESGQMEHQLRMLRRRHRRRRDAMIDAIRTHLPRALVHGTAAGLHLMITFEATFADSDLAAASLARGVKVQPLSWHTQRPSQPGLVLGYAARTPTDISEGIATLGDVLRRLPRAAGNHDGRKATEAPLPRAGSGH